MFLQQDNNVSPAHVEIFTSFIFAAVRQAHYAAARQAGQCRTDRATIPRRHHIGLPAIGATICQSLPTPKTQAGPFGRVPTSVQLLPSADV